MRLLKILFVAPILAVGSFVLYILFEDLRANRWVRGLKEAEDAMDTIESLKAWSARGRIPDGAPEKLAINRNRLLRSQHCLRSRESRERAREALEYCNRSIGNYLPTTV